MRQRAALLRTYLSSSGVALLDEPFSALDTLTKASVHKWYLEVMQHIDLSTLFITHDIDEAILLSDRIYILNGTPGTIKDEIVIQERKPRAEDFALSEEFLEIRDRLLASCSFSVDENKTSRQVSYYLSLSAQKQKPAGTFLCKISS